MSDIEARGFSFIFHNTVLRPEPSINRKTPFPEPHSC